MAATFGIPCPGCGLTRATSAALHGDLHRAFALHPLFFLVTPAYGFLIVWIARDYIRGPDPESGLRTLGPPASSVRHPRAAVLITIAGALLFVLLLAVWIARFFGYFGGPVPVTTWWTWAASNAHAFTR